MTNSVEERIKEQGDLVRKLKSQKADKEQIQGEVAKLLALKKELGVDSGAASNGKAKAVAPRMPATTPAFEANPEAAEKIKKTGRSCEEIEV